MMGKISLGTTIIYDDTSGGEVIHTATLPPTKDTSTNQSTPYATNPSGTALECSAIQNYKMHAFLEFDISSISAGSTIKSAKLFLYKTSRNDNGHTLVFTARRITTSWLENTLTYNLSPSVSSKYGQPYAFGVINEWTVIDLTSMVQEWVNGTFPNYGLALVPELASATTYDFRHHGAWASKENTIIENRPYLLIDYI